MHLCRTRLRSHLFSSEALLACVRPSQLHLSRGKMHFWSFRCTLSHRDFKIGCCVDAECQTTLVSSHLISSFILCYLGSCSTVMGRKSSESHEDSLFLFVTIGSELWKIFQVQELLLQIRPTCSKDYLSKKYFKYV